MPIKNIVLKTIIEKLDISKILITFQFHRKLHTLNCLTLIFHRKLHTRNCLTPLSAVDFKLLLLLLF